MAAVVRAFPRIPTLALLSGAGDTNAEAVLSLGNCGIRTLIDVRKPEGWSRLRALLGREATRDADRLVLAALREDLRDVPDDCWRFFEALFSPEFRVSTVRQLARRLNVLPSTLMSRFFRARLPAAQTLPRVRSPDSCRAAVRESGVVHIGRRESPRLLVATELRPARAYGAEHHRRRVSLYLRWRTHAGPVPSRAHPAECRAAAGTSSAGGTPRDASRVVSSAFTASMQPRPTAGAAFVRAISVARASAMTERPAALRSPGRPPRDPRRPARPARRRRRRARLRRRATPNRRW